MEFTSRLRKQTGGARAWVTLVLSMFVTVPAAGCGAPYAAPGADSKDATILLGREIFINNCSNCHGLTGEGISGPRLTDAALLDRFPTSEHQQTFIKQGNEFMPGFGETLDADEIAAVVRYVRDVMISP